MTARTLFVIILKVLGILSLKELLVSLTKLFMFLFDLFGGFSLSGSLLAVSLSLLAIAIDLAISYYLIFKADFLVSKFGLDSGISEPTLQLNINTTLIFQVAIVVTSFLILVFEIPQFCRIVIDEVQNKDISFFERQSDWSTAIVSGVKIIIGFLLIGERRRIVELIAPNPKAEETA